MRQMLSVTMNHLMKPRGESLWLDRLQIQERNEFEKSCCDLISRSFLKYSSNGKIAKESQRLSPQSADKTKLSIRQVSI